ncbi:MAG TPA: superoxide dismutase [Cu-Zn] SodC [Hyphomicrobiales bacterium]|nr:superoxide dismutase [Cu-Zn] SodC [Hyphomicrobiales bacterium]
MWRLVLIISFLGIPAASAATATVTINKIDEKGVGPSIGTIVLTDTNQGMRIEPKLTGLPPGNHGFHVHAKPDCGPAEQNGKQVAGFAAGGHFDPHNTGKHLGPQSTEGHMGDMPVLAVDDKGNAGGTLLASRLKVDEVKGHSIMIHAGGDNYSDSPAPLGGGGARIACGVFK